jgi:hypothetical protein
MGDTKRIMSKNKWERGTIVYISGEYFYVKGNMEEVECEIDEALTYLRPWLVLIGQDDIPFKVKPTKIDAICPGGRYKP